MAGVIVLILAVVAAIAVGAIARRRTGKIHYFSQTDPPGSPVPGRSPRAVITAEELGESLGERATLVQFSTELCAYCGPTRQLLAELARERPGVAVVEIDAAERIDLTKRLRVFSTPTVFVLGRDGTVAARASGKPERAELAESLRSVMGKGVRS